MDIHQEHLYTFEGLLVKEFRCYQALLSLTKNERLALSRSDITHLLDLAGDKESLLDKLGKLDDRRRILLDNLGDTFPSLLVQVGGTGPLAAVLGSFEQDEVIRIVHLQEGILVLLSQVRELTRGNRALASTALERASALQLRLMELWQRPATVWNSDLIPIPVTPEYISPQAVQETSLNTALGDQIVLPALFAAIVAARDALDAKDNAAISAAINNLQNALDRFGDHAQTEGKRRGKVKDLAEYLEGAQPRRKFSKPGKDINLVEVIADLYQQETAYQAVLKTSNRMLASA